LGDDYWWTISDSVLLWAWARILGWNNFYGRMGVWAVKFSISHLMSPLATRDLFFDLLQVCVEHAQHMGHEQVSNTVSTFAQSLEDWPEALKE
jgi:hypothetical protein